jgi:septal ring factor EnvC (AmiA/AmiB activator)
MIELQKAKLASDIMRFRRYLGVQYQDPVNSSDKGQLQARQIYCIFLLDYGSGLPERPVLEVNYRLRDVTTGEDLDTVNKFVEGLHHHSWIVQIRQLKERRRNDLEKLLSIFDQSNRTFDHHLLNVNEEDFPEEYRHIVRRLRKAHESEEMRGQMELEDDILEELRRNERKIAELSDEKDKAFKAIEEKDKAIREQGKAIEERDKSIEEKAKEIEEKDKAIEKQGKEIEELKRLLNKK